MRNILLTAGLSLMIFGANAQKLGVNTSPENRKVILEEFTGIHCGYCPDGHKRANDLVAAYPDQVILVNIHSGGYAVPSAPGDPDFRTTAGSSIDAAASISGYPAGSINRVVPTTPQKAGGLAMNRNEWVNVAPEILGQQSPVNVKVVTNLDPKTRKLTVEVEGYYTANSAKPANYLTVMLLQDGILGPQSDYGGIPGYNPDNWVEVNGVRLYKHNHVLRMTFTPAFGEKIDSTSQGNMFYRKYTTDLPVNQINTAINMNKLVVVAFVAEGQTNILNGAETKVEFDPSYRTDLSVANLTPSFATNLCLSTVNPKVEVTNKLDKDITSFDIIANINGMPSKKSFSGLLKPNEKTTFDWGALNFQSGGDYSVSIGNITNINNNSLFDVDESNDQVSITGIGFAHNAMTSVKGQFEAAVLPPNFAIDRSQNAKVELYNASKAGAFGTTGAIRYSLHSSWNVNGKPGPIEFGEVNLTGMTQPYLTYCYAYSDKGNVTATGAYGGTPPVINTQVSTDCGATWTTLQSITCTERGAPTQAGAYFIPKSTDYFFLAVPLSDYKDKSVLLRVVGIPGSGGNAMYIDEITVGQAASIAAKGHSVMNINVYPNPATDNANLAFSLMKPGSVTVTLTNTLGQQVSTVVSEQKLAAGDYKYDINTSNLKSGVYFATVTIDGASYTQRLSVIR